MQLERLRAFREMAGEVAHDFNNTLSGILARAQLLLADVQDPDVRRSLRMIEQVALEGAWVVRRFQDFSRTRPSRPFQPVDLNQLVDEIANSARSRWSQQLAARGITGEVHAETGPVPLVSGDMAELRQVLTSIALNALDAMPEGGNLTFRTGRERGRVFCQVADTGIGMTEQVRLHIFDPFFTTKREKGKGFGLSGAYSIVDRHGGEITVQSEPGKGAVFTVWLPLVAEAAEPLPTAGRAPSTASTATRRAGRAARAEVGAGRQDPRGGRLRGGPRGPAGAPEPPRLHRGHLPRRRVRPGGAREPAPSISRWWIWACPASPASRSPSG